MHNGRIAEFHRVKRELAPAIDPDLYPMIEGSTDTEVFFYLALTFGMSKGPPSAVERAVGLIEQVCPKRAIDAPIRMSVAVSDGKLIPAAHYGVIEPGDDQLRKFAPRSE